MGSKYGKTMPPKGKGAKKHPMQTDATKRIVKRGSTPGALPDDSMLRGSMLETYRQENHIPMVNPSGDGSNTFNIGFLAKVLEISKQADAERPETLRNCFLQYLQLCAENDVKIGNMAAYSSMGISMQTAYAWKTGKARASNKAYKELIQDVERICAMYREMMMGDGKINPVVGLWWQKNFDHMKDTPPEDVAEHNALGDNMSSTELAEKYKDYEE